MKIVSENVVGRPTTVGEMIDCLSKLDRDLPITYENDSTIRLIKIAVDPDEDELLDFTVWVQVEDEY
jgi:hypothetical protein